MSELEPYQVVQGEKMVFPDNGYWFHWCCNCDLRHIWNLKIVKYGNKRYIEIKGTSDPLGTKLYKFYKKHKKDEQKLHKGKKGRI